MTFVCLQFGLPLPLHVQVYVYYVRKHRRKLDLKILQWNPKDDCIWRKASHRQELEKTDDANVQQEAEKNTSK